MEKLELEDSICKKMRKSVDKTIMVIYNTLCCDGVWLSLARAPGLGPGGRRFESCHPDSYKYARVAQLVERDLAKVEAAGSSPVSRSFLLLRKL